MMSFCMLSKGKFLLIDKKDSVIRILLTAAPPPPASLARPCPAVDHSCDDVDGRATYEGVTGQGHAQHGRHGERLGHVCEDPRQHHQSLHL